MSRSLLGTIDYGNPISEHPLNEGLVSRWMQLPLRRGGLRLIDLNGKHHGTLTGGPTWQGVRGRPGGWGSLSFDGSDDEVRCNGTLTGVGNLVSTPWTISCWANFTSTSGTQCALSMGGNGSDGNVVVIELRSSQIRLAKGGGDLPLAISSVSPAASVWYFILGTYDGSSVSTIYIFTNTTRFSDSSSALSPPSVVPVSLTIGQYRDPRPFDPFAGLIDDVRIYNRSSSAAEVYSHYLDSRQGSPLTIRRHSRIRWFLGGAGGATGLSAGLISQWTMNEASGNRADSIDSNTLTDNNTVTSTTGLLGNAASFSAGSSEYLQAPSGFINSYSSWSISGWFKPTSTALGSSWARVIDFGTGTTQYLFFTVLSGVFSPRPSIGLKLGPGTEWQSGLPTAFVADAWHHLCVTCSDGRVAVFIDGICVSGISGRDATGGSLAPTLAYFGKAQFADPYFDGLMDTWHLWNRELTPEEAEGLYNSGTPLVYPFTGAVIPDAPTPNVNGRLEYQLFSFNELDESLSLFESADGVYWTNYAVSYTPSSGTVRDPSAAMVGSQWWLIHTRSASGGTSFTVAKADDATLESWSHVAFADTSAVVTVGHTWAPEFARNADGTVYLDGGDGFPRVIVALQVGAGTSNVLHEIHPTNAGWTTWSTPVALTGTAIPADTIDGFPIFMGGSTWKMWIKDEGVGVIKLMTSTTSLTAGWDTIVSDPGSWGTGHEGVSAFKFGGVWKIYVDRYGADAGIGYASSSDDFATVSGMSGIAADILPRHGTIIFAPDTIFTSLTPVIVTASVVTPSVTLSHTLTPVSALNSVVAPTQSLAHTVSPIAAVLTGIAPTPTLGQSLTPAMISGSGVAPSSSLGVSVDPIGGTFTLPAVGTGGTIDENPSPVTTALSLVTATDSLGADQTPVGATSSVVTPTPSFDNTPSSVVLSGAGVAPSSAMALSVDPVTGATSVVSPIPNIQPTISPIGIVSSTIDVTWAMDNAPSPVVAVFTMPFVSTGGEIFEVPDPVAFTSSAVTSTESFSQEPTPATFTSSGVTPSSSMSLDITPVTFTGSGVSPDSSLGLDVSPVSFTSSVPTVDVARVTTPDPIAFTSGVVSVTTALNNTPSPVVILSVIVAPSVLGGDVVTGPYYIDACQVYSPGYTIMQAFTPGPIAVQVGEI